MQCPYCGAAMEEGLVSSSKGNLYWRGGKVLPAWFPQLDHAKVLSRDGLTRARLAGRYCPACRKIVIALDEAKEN